MCLKFGITNESEESNPTPIEMALVPLMSSATAALFTIFIQQPMQTYLKNRTLPMVIAFAATFLSSIPMIFLMEDIRGFIYPLAII